MATETKEVRISYTSVQILCTKAVGGAPSVMNTPVKSVGISKGLASTEQDIAPSTHIVPFAGCNYMGQCMACAPAGKWKLPAESTVNIVKRVPLVEDSEFDCTARGGKITFNFDPAKTVPPANKKPNIVDKAKAKINSAANSVIKNATKVVKDITEGITGTFDGLKPVLENTQAANLATTLDTQVQKLNELKKQTDSRVEDLEKEITELKKKIEAKLTGTAYKPPKDEEKETEIQITTEKDEIDLQNAEEEKRNEALYDEGTNEAIKEYEDFINSKITPTTTVREVEVEKDIASINNDIIVESAISSPNTNASDKENNTTKKYLDQLSGTSKDLGLDKNEDAQEALKLLDNMDTILVNDPKGSVADQAKVVIQNERNTLNSRVQASIDEELKELGYFEKLKKYKEESNDLQKDIDKASLTLKSVGDFGGFIDGLKNKYLGKIGAKYSESLNKLSNNLTTLNTSMDGLSYMADGFPKGEVFTNVIREVKEEEDEEEDGIGIAGAGINSGTGSTDPRDDQNLEPKILKIFVANDNKTKFEESAVDIDTELYIVIQANGKAKGKTVELDLANQMNQYEMIDNYNENGDGVYNIININGASPNFENGETYVNDGLPYVDQDLISTEGTLDDKTYVKVKAIAPSMIEEENNAIV